jgi:hypothetical protein
MSPVDHMQCYQVLDLHRLQCEACNAIWSSHLPFMIGKHRFVRFFALTVIDLFRFGTSRSLAHYFLAVIERINLKSPHYSR